MHMLTFGHTAALQNFKLDTFLKTKSGCGKLYWPICSGNVLCFRVNICRYLNTSRNPTWGKQNDANPHQGWRNPTKCGCIITIALAKLNCRFAEHLFWLILKCSMVYGHDSWSWSCQLSTQHICIILSVLIFWSHSQQKSIERNVYASKQALCNRSAIMTRCLVAEWPLLFQNTKTTFIDCQFSHFGYQYFTLVPRLEHIAVLFTQYWTESTYWLTVIAFWLPILHRKIGYNIAIILISHRNEKNAIAQGCLKHIYK